MQFLAAKAWHLDVDRYINPYIPPNRLDRLPKPISHFLGYRKNNRNEIGNVLVSAWSFLGAFVGVMVIEAVFMIPEIQKHEVPLLIASFGAAAILEYNTIESPLAQPRNTIVGHTLAALVGITITKLFSLNPNFENLRWIAGALACGLASALMTITKTVYPPAGATALLAAVDPQVERLGWYLLPLVLISTFLTLVVSLLINNIQRRYPTYWWTPADLRQNAGTDDIERTEKRLASSQTSFRNESQHFENIAEHTITIFPHRIIVPNNMYLAQEEAAILEILRQRLGNELPRHPEPSARTSDETLWTT